MKLFIFISFHKNIRKSKSWNHFSFNLNKILDKINIKKGIISNAINCK